MKYPLLLTLAVILLCSLEPNTASDSEHPSLRGLFTSCTSNDDCAPIQCFVAPCDDNICIDGRCTLQPAAEEDEEDTTIPDINPLPQCEVDEDCAPIHCFVAPCDLNLCIDGYCTLQPAIEEEEDREDEIILDSNTTVSVGNICGTTTCGENEVCCNPSCGICVSEQGGTCSNQICEGGNATSPEVGQGEFCGAGYCDEGEVCCNDSCGICTPPNGACTLQLCMDPIDPENIVGEVEEDEDVLPTLI